MSDLNKTLAKQLQKAGLLDLKDDEKFKILFKNISASYNEYEEQLERSNNTLDVSLKTSLLLTKKIKESAENDFQLLIEGLPGLISWFDQDLNYLGVNENFLNFTKQTKDQFIGKHLGTIHGEKNSDLINDFAKFAKSNELSYQLDYKILLNNEIHYMFSHFQKIKNGKIIIIASIDLSEREKMQEIINQQNELATKNSKLASLGEMAAGIAHEINNPLTVILGYSKQILTSIDVDINKFTPESYRAKIEKIYRMSLRVSSIVKNLKKISRDDTFDPFIETPFKEIISVALELNQEKMKTYEIVFSLEGDTEVLLSCQPVSLSQVFLNLINNSIDAIKDTPKAWIKCLVESNENEVIIKMVDSGNGISEANKDKIFQPFYTTKDVDHGTGLGLSISKGIINSHSGSFDLDFENENTCFVIVLPHLKKLAEAM